MNLFSFLEIALLRESAYSPVKRDEGRVRERKEARGKTEREKERAEGGCENGENGKFNGLCFSGMEKTTEHSPLPSMPSVVFRFSPRRHARFVLKSFYNSTPDHPICFSHSRSLCRLRAK